MIPSRSFFPAYKGVDKLAGEVSVTGETRSFTWEGSVMVLRPMTHDQGKG